MIRNSHWYNLNEQRSYPIDETASAADSDGRRIPNSFLADLRLTWPLSAGRYSFISAAAVTATNVSLLISACDTLDNDPDDAVLIAGITRKLSDIVAHGSYTLDAFISDVVGIVSFGSNLDEVFSAVCSGPSQSLLTARAARAFISSNMPALRLLGSATYVNGFVDIAVREPLTISRETLTIGGNVQDNTLVFDLVENRATAADSSVFEIYSGKCDQRVSSRNCGDPQPLETINDVKPDCDGVLTLDFQGCAIVAQNTSDCGVVVDCNLSLDQTCQPPYLPDDSEGRLPGDIPPLVIPPPDPDPPGSDSASDSISDSYSGAITLPYCDTFDLGVATGFSPIGPAMFTMVADESPAEDFCCSGPPAAVTTEGCDLSESVSGSFVPYNPALSYGTGQLAARIYTHISLFTLDSQVLYREYATDLKVQPNIAGAQGIAGILVNYKVSGSGLPSYYLAVVDTVNFTFGIYLYNGISRIPLITVQDYSIREDEWMRLRFAITPGATPYAIDLTASLDGITRLTLDVDLTTTITAEQWGTDSGDVGLYIDRSLAHFSFWRVDLA
jgi:hypothetical protein